MGPYGPYILYFEAYVHQGAPTRIVPAPRLVRNICSYLHKKIAHSFTELRTPKMLSKSMLFG